MNDVFVCEKCQLFTCAVVARIKGFPKIETCKENYFMRGRILFGFKNIFSDFLSKFEIFWWFHDSFEKIILASNQICDSKSFFRPRIEKFLTWWTLKELHICQLFVISSGWSNCSQTAIPQISFRSCKIQICVTRGLHFS